VLSAALAAFSEWTGERFSSVLSAALAAFSEWTGERLALACAGAVLNFAVSFVLLAVPQRDESIGSSDGGADGLKRPPRASPW